MKHQVEKILVAMAFLTPAAWPVHAEGDIDAGKEKSAVCASCHGELGEAVLPDYPNLGGQYPDYLEQALRAYRSGARKNPIMAGFAAGLSDQDIEDLAAYFAAQEGLFVLED